MNALEPILPGFYPDPSICRVGEDYYLVTSSFHYFPGVPVFHSRDLVNWTQIGHCLTRPEQLPLEGAKTSGGIYAPTIRHHDGVFYMITTNVSQQQHFIVTATDPAGEWSDPVWIESPRYNTGSRGIDPSLFFDEDGKVYFSWTNGVAGGNHMFQALLEVATGSLLEEPREVWKGTGGQHAEAPHLYKIDGWYYLMLAEGGTSYGHMITIARSQTPYGPWESCPHNPLLTHRSLDIPVQATGHGDLVEDGKGNWWMVFLGVRPDMGHPRAYHLGRESFIAPVVWENGWPVVGVNGRMTPDMALPAGENLRNFDHIWKDEFLSKAPALEWNYLRNPDRSAYIHSEVGLLLHGRKGGLDDAGSPTWIGRRQQHARCEIEVDLEWLAGDWEGAAGLTAYMDEAHHYDIYLSRSLQRYEICVRLRIGPLCQIVARLPWKSQHATLVMKAEPLHYSFVVMEKDPVVLFSAPTRYLTTEVAQGFTGVYAALFTEGEGCTARIHHFTYKPLK